MLPRPIGGGPRLLSAPCMAPLPNHTIVEGLTYWLVVLCSIILQNVSRLSVILAKVPVLEVWHAEGFLSSPAGRCLKGGLPSQVPQPQSGVDKWTVLPRILQAYLVSLSCWACFQMQHWASPLRKFIFVFYSLVQASIVAASQEGSPAPPHEIANPKLALPATSVHAAFWYLQPRTRPWTHFTAAILKPPGIWSSLNDAEAE